MAKPQPSADEPKQDEEFDNFRRLTKDLLRVPKKEIDRKVKADDEKRRRRAT